TAALIGVRSVNQIMARCQVFWWADPTRVIAGMDAVPIVVVDPPTTLCAAWRHLLHQQINLQPSPIWILTIAGRLIPGRLLKTITTTKWLIFTCYQNLCNSY